MSAIDQRIVQMKFENHLFEKNAQTSISTLEKLKQALNFGGATKSFSEVETAAKKIDFSRLTDSITTISDRFSTMGIVGMTAIQNLTNAAIDLGKTLASKVISPITTGGWNRATAIDQAEFKIKGLEKDWEALSEAISYGVNETAYGFGEAASVAAQLVASGIEENGELMKASLRGISGVAAMTNSTYEDIGHIYTTIAGEGKLTNMRLDQFAVRGLNARAKLATALGKTEDEVRELAKDGQISFEQFAMAMDEAFGEHAKKGNETFEGSMANMKSALGRIGAEFATPIRKNMIPVFNALREKFNEFKEIVVMNDKALPNAFDNLTAHMAGFFSAATKAVDLGWFKSIVSFVTNAFNSIDSFMSRLTPLWTKVTEGAEEVNKALSPVAMTLEEIDEWVDKIIRGDYGNGEERFLALDAELGEHMGHTLQNYVNERLECEYRYDDALDLTSQKIEENVEAQKQQENVITKISGSYASLVLVIKSAANAFRNMFNETEKGMIFDNFVDFIKGGAEFGDILIKTFTALVSGAFQPMVRIVRLLIVVGSEALSTIGLLMGKLNTFLTNNKVFLRLKDVVNTTFTAVADVFAIASRHALGFFTAIQDGSWRLPSIFYDIKRIGGTAFSTLTTTITNAWKSVGNLKTTYSTFVTALKQTSGFKRLSSYFEDFKNKVIEVKNNAVDLIVNQLENLSKNGIKLPEIDATGLATKVGAKIDELLNKIEEFKKKVKTWFNEKGVSKDSIINWFNSIFEGFDLTTVEGWLSFFDAKKKQFDKLIESFFDETNPMFGGIVKHVKAFVTSILTLLGQPLSEAAESATNFFDKFMLALKDFELPTLDDIVGGIVGIYKKFTQINLVRALNGILRGFAGLGGILDNLNGVIAVFKFTLFTVSFNYLSDSVLKLAKSFAIMAASFFLLGNMSEKQLWPAVLGLIAISAAIIGLVHAVSGRQLYTAITPLDALSTILGSLSFSIKKFLTQVGRSSQMIAIVAGAAILAKTIIEISELPWTKAKRGFTIMLGCIGALAIAVIAIDSIGSISGASYSVGKALEIVAIGYAIQAIAETALMLANLKASELALSITAIGAISFFIGKLMESMRDIKGSAVLPVLGTIGLLALMFGGLWLLSEKANPNKVLKIGEAVGAVAASMAALIWALTKTKGMSWSDVGRASVMLVAVGAVIGALSLIVSQMQGVKGDDALKIAGAIDSVLLCIGLLSFAMKKITKDTAGATFWNGAAIAGVMVVWITAIWGVMTILGELSKDQGVNDAFTKGQTVIESIAATMKKLAWFILIVAATQKLLGNEKGNLSQFATAFVSLVGWITGLTVVFAALGKLSELFGDGKVAEWIGNMAPILSELGNALGQGINGLMRGLMGLGYEGEQTKVQKIQELLDIAALFKDLKGDNAINVQGVRDLGDFFMAFAKAEFASGVAGMFSFLGGIGGSDNMEEFGSKIVTFAEKMVAYSNIAEGIKADVVEKTSKAIETVIAFSQDIPNEGNSLLKGLVGDNTLGDFAKHLIPFGLAMVAYSKCMEGVKSNVVKKTSKAVETVIAFSKQVPNQGTSLLSLLVGDNKLSDFGKNLEPFASNMKAYSHIIKDVDTEAVNGTETAVKSVLALAEMAPETGGLIGAIFGNFDLKEFGSQLRAFANGVVGYSEKIDGVELKNSDTVIESVEKILKIGQTISSDFDAGFMGETLATKISNAGTSVSEAIEAIDKLLSDSLIENIDRVDSIGPKLVDFGDYIRQYYEKIKEVPKDELIANTNASITDLNAIFKDQNLTTTLIDDVIVHGQNIKDYASIMHTFAADIKKVTEKSVAGATNAYDAITMLSDSTSFSSTLVDSVVSVKQNLIDFVKAANDIADQLKGFDEDAADKAKKTIELVNAFSATKTDTVSSIIDSFFGPSEDVTKGANAVDVAGQLIEFATSMVEFVGIMQTIEPDTALEDLESIMGILESDRFQKLFQNNNTGFSRIIEGLSEVALNVFTSEEFLGEAEALGTSFVTALMAGFNNNENTATITSGINDMVDAVSGVMSSEDTKKELTDTATKFVDGMVSELTTNLENNNETVGGKAYDMIKMVASSIESGEGDTTKSIETVSKAMLKEANLEIPNFETLGGDIILGLVKGMSSKQSIAQTTASTILRSVLRTSKAAVESNSPSKKFIELGEDNILGLAIGMDREAKTANTTAKNIGNALLSTVSDTVTDASDDAQEMVNSVFTALTTAYIAMSSMLTDSTIKPVISPVLDLSNVYSGMGDISSLFSGMSYGLPFTPYTKTLSSNDYRAVNYDQAEIVKSITGLHSDIASLGEAMSKMQVLMSTGEMVGAITSGVDRELGTIQKYNARWA